MGTHGDEMNSMKRRRDAKRESFSLVPETCPHVDGALEEASRLIKIQTTALREALVNALARAAEAEERIEDLEREVDDLKCAAAYQ